MGFLLVPPSRTCCRLSPKVLKISSFFPREQNLRQTLPRREPAGQGELRGCGDLRRGGFRGPPQHPSPFPGVTRERSSILLRGAAMPARWHRTLEGLGGAQLYCGAALSARVVVPHPTPTAAPHHHDHPLGLRVKRGGFLCPEGWTRPHLPAPPRQHTPAPPPCPEASPSKGWSPGGGLAAARAPGCPQRGGQ